jgi:Putative tRNA binding domain.
MEQQIDRNENRFRHRDRHAHDFAGIRKFVNFSDLIGKKYVFVVNLAERKLGEGTSQGMMLVAGDETGHFPLRVDDMAKEGAQIR